MSTLEEKQKAHDEHFRWAFARAIAYLKEGDLKNAKASFMSDYNKDGHVSIINPLLFMIINSARTAPEIIQAIAGLGEAPDDIKIYYDNPKLALQ